MARAHALAAGIWALRLPLTYRYVRSVTAYLLEADDGHVLVDCGSPLGDGWEVLVAALAEAGARPSDVGTLVCTHGHPDHYGLAADVVERTGCRLAMAPGPHPPTDVLRDPTRPWDERRALHRRHGTPEAEILDLSREINGDGRHRRAQPNAELDAGDVVEARSGGWEVVRVPGHCADQIALWHPERRWLIGADLAMRDVRPFVEYGTSADPHGDYLDSLDRALALEPEVLLPGHGRPVTEPAEVLAQSRAFVLDGAERVIAGLDAEPRSAYELAQRLRAPDATLP
ncbi:MAG: beta-lactamase domain protein, partial [Solirubrobacterales bacterium]|nr:beta-lactamase domain protein [Solirubrobacterales bacterium]